MQRRVEREMADLLDEVVARDVPFLGACYGVGTLGVHQGGGHRRTYGEPIGAVTHHAHRRPAAPTHCSPACPRRSTRSSATRRRAACCRRRRAARLVTHLPGADVPGPRENLYATQFHPELDTDGIVTRLTVYREDGYYRPEEIDDVIARVRSATVTEPHRLLAAFVRRYARV